MRSLKKENGSPSPLLLLHPFPVQGFRQPYTLSYFQIRQFRPSWPLFVRLSSFNCCDSRPYLLFLGLMGGGIAENSQGGQAAAAVQIPRELPSIYRWVTNDMLGTPSSLDQQYLDELKLTGVLFGGGDLERRYRVEASRLGNGSSPQPSFRAPSQLHPNVWSSIRCFELVTEFLELPQDPEVFLYLFKLYSSNTSGKTKKGYTSVRSGKHRKIFGLYEDSFHDFKGRYFKIFPVGDHRPFWLSLEGDGLFPPYWSDKVGFDVVPVTSQIPAEYPGEARRAIGNFCFAGAVPQARVARATSGPSSLGWASTPPIILMSRNRATPERGSSNETGRGQDHLVDVSSPLREEELRHPSPRKRPAEAGVGRSKRPKVSEGGPWEFSAMDRSFDASGFIVANLLGPCVQEALRDYDPVESVRWVEWAMLRAATILKSVEPCLTVADEVERWNAKLLGDLKVLDLQKLIVEEEKADAVAAKLKDEEELKSAETRLETLAKEKDQEIERLKLEAERFRGLVAEEKVRADLAEVSMSEL
ncbi:hypothetical protein PIB30_086182 [Stylosanthes scabra]|uniref:Uncharacterized protein n=1 Tax=Stylosanthes scabra TaxID=79078 RepID=A0ABU6ZRN4_9FABA|nr:hypothetical protein [Stylosanthes scabra]